MSDFIAEQPYPLSISSNTPSHEENAITSEVRAIGIFAIGACFIKRFRQAASAVFFESGGDDTR